MRVSSHPGDLFDQHRDRRHIPAVRSEPLRDEGRGPERHHNGRCLSGGPALHRLQFGRDDLDHHLSTDCALAAEDDGLSLKGVVQSLL